MHVHIDCLRQQLGATRLATGCSDDEWNSRAVLVVSHLAPNVLLTKPPTVVADQLKDHKNVRRNASLVVVEAIVFRLQQTVRC